MIDEMLVPDLDVFWRKTTNADSYEVHVEEADLGPCLEGWIKAKGW